MLQTFDAIMQPLITRVYLLHKNKKYKGLLTFYSFFCIFNDNL